jgi:hypothetical protein
VNHKLRAMRSDGDDNSPQMIARSTRANQINDSKTKTKTLLDIVGLCWPLLDFFVEFVVCGSSLPTAALRFHSLQQAVDVPNFRVLRV